MDNQFAQPQVIVQRLILVIVPLCLIVGIAILSVHLYNLSDPYYKEVLSLPANYHNGEAIFQINCSGCHGRQGDGDIGPSLKNVAKHKSRIEIINQVTSGNTPPMPKFQPTPQEMANLLDYLEQM